MYALMEHCADMMFAKGYTNECIQSHRKRWHNKILPFVLTFGSPNYTRSIGEAYRREKTKGLSRSCVKGHASSINILTEYLESHDISKRLKTAPQYFITGELGAVLNDFLTYAQKEQRLRDMTIIAHTRSLYMFVNGLFIKGYKSIRELVAEDGLDYLNSSSTGMYERLTALRSFFKYLYQRQLIDFDCLETVANFHIPQNEPLPSTYSDQEIATFVATAKGQTQSKIGKRDYAMFLLACKLGLRSSDIRFLRFSNIDWKNKFISIKQYKTDVELQLPLLHDVGEAIINYIKFGRPDSDLTYVFLTDNCPYRPLSATVISHNFARIISNSGIKKGKRHMGAHSLRHSLATQLLKNGTSLPVISEILGHTSTESTMCYIGVERETLLQYALDSQLIPDSFYNQKGGSFYV